MLRLFKYLKDFKLQVLVIVLLLLLQAYCELALPQYTSNIVDIGITREGISDAVPDTMRAETMGKLCLFIKEEDIEIVASAYSLTAEGNYELTKTDRETKDTLNSIFTVPMVILSSMEGSAQAGESGLDAASFQAMIENGIITKGELMQRIEAKIGDISSIDESVLSQRAIAFVKAEYKTLGLDTGKMQTNYLLTSGAKMLGVTCLMVAAAIMVGFFSAQTAGKIGMNLRGKVFRKVVSFSNGDVERFTTASLITRSTNDIQQVQMTTVMMLRMVIYSPILAIGGVLKVVNTNTGMAWIIAAAAAIVMALAVVLIMVAMPKFKKAQVLLDRINQVAREILTGLLVIRAFSRETYEEKRFNKASEDLMKTQLFTNRIMTFMMPLMMLIMNGVTLAIVWFGAKNIDAGTLEVGNMLAFITYAMQIIMSFLMLSIMSIMVPRAGVAAGRIDEVLAVKPSIRDRETVKDDTKSTWNGVVRFESVSFRYPDAEHHVLEDITFTALPGQTTAIIGGTGSGKSTLLNLIPRFFDVTEGRITLDGFDVRDLSQHKLRDMLGYVPQKGVLFTGDIESNLKYAGDMVSDDDMVQAAQIAQATGFIESKSEKYQASISQGGTNVSGGQRQRLSIARAIAKKPKVMLFDDSFSALDYKTDLALRRALSENIKDATVIIVAQRISTILHADQIIVLDEGKVAGIGRHEELLETCGMYQEIAKSQLSEAELKGGHSA